MPDTLMNLDEGDKKTPPPEGEKKDPPPEGDKKTPPPEGDKKDGDKPQRPENIPEKFWDKEKGVVKVDDVLKSYTELEKENSKSKQVPEKYDIVIPEKLKDKVDLKEDDPMLQNYLAHAKNAKYTQEKVNSDIEFYLSFMEGQLAKDLDAEVEKLGGKEKAVKVVGELKKWGQGVLSEEAYNFMEGMAVNANAIKFLQEVRKIAGVQEPPPEEGDVTKVAGELTDKELHAMMQKEEYWNPLKRDAKLVKQVTEGFQKLYAKKSG